MTGSRTTAEAIVEHDEAGRILDTAAIGLCVRQSTSCAYGSLWRAGALLAFIPRLSFRRSSACRALPSSATASTTASTMRHKFCVCSSVELVVKMIAAAASSIARIPEETMSSSLLAERTQPLDAGSSAQYASATTETMRTTSPPSCLVGVPLSPRKKRGEIIEAAGTLRGPLACYHLWHGVSLAAHSQDGRTCTAPTCVGARADRLGWDQHSRACGTTTTRPSGTTRAVGATVGSHSRDMRCSFSPSPSNPDGGYSLEMLGSERPW